MAERYLLDACAIIAYHREFDRVQEAKELDFV